MKVKHIIILFIFGNLLLANEYNNDNPKKQIIQQSENDDSDKLYRKRRGSKGKKGRHRGGNGLR